MPVVQFEIQRRAAYADGAAFGDAGPYERLDASVTFAVDPTHEANRSIADIDLAPRDAEGRVRFRSDLILLTPALAGHGNGSLIVDVVNRGGPLTPRLNRARPTNAR